MIIYVIHLILVNLYVIDSIYMIFKCGLLSGGEDMRLCVKPDNSSFLVLKLFRYFKKSFNRFHILL